MQPGATSKTTISLDEEALCSGVSELLVALMGLYGGYDGLLDNQRGGFQLNDEGAAIHFFEAEAPMFPQPRALVYDNRSMDSDGVWLTLLIGEAMPQATIDVDGDPPSQEDVAFAKEAVRAVGQRIATLILFDNTAVAH